MRAKWILGSSILFLVILIGCGSSSERGADQTSGEDTASDVTTDDGVGPDSDAVRDSDSEPVDQPGGDQSTSDLSAVDLVVPSGACLSGPQAPDDLGPQPDGASSLISCLEIRNDRGIERSRELAFSGIPIAKSVGLVSTQNLVVAGPGGRWLQAQFNVLSRWGGTVSDTTKPIRWLQVSLLANLPANTTVSYSLRRYQQTPSAPADPLALTVQNVGERYLVRTGPGEFELDPASPALFHAIRIAGGTDFSSKTTVFSASNQAGPRLVLADDTVLDQANGNLQVDSNSFKILEQGPVKAVVQLSGHFVHGSHADVVVDCADDNKPYPRFGFTVVATFVRGSRDAILQFQFRNECGDGFGASLTDQAVSVKRVSFELPLTMQSPLSHVSDGKTLFSSTAFVTGETRVEQQKAGVGNGWTKRRAQILRDGQTLDSGEFYQNPFLALVDQTLVAAIQMPWMRYREPQALVSRGTTLSLQVVSDSLLIGEAKGLWNFARLSFRPAGTDLAQLRDRGRLELERGLLIRVPLETFNQSGIYPSLGSPGVNSKLKTIYEAIIARLHEDTVRPGGQWDRAKTYGSQLWPDIQTFPEHDFANPYVNSGASNYWNPLGAELLEFFRTGDPKWVWDFALPQAYLQLFTVYYNLGRQNHGNRTAFTVTSGGEGEGQWHRSNFGSDDYSYNQGIDEAFVIRPNYPMRDRFWHGGEMVIDRWNQGKDEEDQRDIWLNTVVIARGVFQKFDMLAYCAEFVPGEQGKQCLAKLTELWTELARDNLKQGQLCADDKPNPSGCDTPQQFMINSMMYHSIYRYYRMYGDIEGHLKRALVDHPWNLYRFGIEKEADNLTPKVGGCFADGMSCTFTNDGLNVADCKSIPNSDQNLCMWDTNRPHTLALLLIAHQIDPKHQLCSVVKKAFETDALFRPILESSETDLNNPNQTGPGWIKPTSQTIQGLIFALGGIEACN